MRSSCTSPASRAAMWGYAHPQPSLGMPLTCSAPLGSAPSQRLFACRVRSAFPPFVRRCSCSPATTLYHNATTTLCTLFCSSSCSPSCSSGSRTRSPRTRAVAALQAREDVQLDTSAANCTTHISIYRFWTLVASAPHSNDGAVLGRSSRAVWLLTSLDLPT